VIAYLESPLPGDWSVRVVRDHERGGVLFCIDDPAGSYHRGVWIPEDLIQRARQSADPPRMLDLLQLQGVREELVAGLDEHRPGLIVVKPSPM
jgi:hypothetical protein